MSKFVNGHVTKMRFLILWIASFLTQIFHFKLQGRCWKDDAYMHIFSGEYTATDEVNGKYSIFTNRLCGLPVDKPRLGWRLNLLQYSSPQQVLQEVIELTYIF